MSHLYDGKETDEESEDQLSEENLSNHKLSGHQLSNERLSNDKVSNGKMSNNQMSNERSNPICIHNETSPGLENQADVVQELAKKVCRGKLSFSELFVNFSDPDPDPDPDCQSPWSTFYYSPKF